MTGVISLPKFEFKSLRKRYEFVFELTIITSTPLPSSWKTTTTTTTTTTTCRAPGHPLARARHSALARGGSSPSATSRRPGIGGVEEGRPRCAPPPAEGFDASRPSLPQGREGRGEPCPPTPGGEGGREGGGGEGGNPKGARGEGSLGGRGRAGEVPPRGPEEG